VKIETFIGKLSYRSALLEEKYIENGEAYFFFRKLLQMECSVIHIFRDNCLDVALCNARDFSQNSKSLRENLFGDIKSGNSFSAWRRADQRKEYQFTETVEEIIYQSLNILAKRRIISSYLQQFNGNVFELNAESLMRVQWDSSPTSLSIAYGVLHDLMNYLNLPFCGETTESFLMELHGTRNFPLSHASIKFSEDYQSDFKDAVFKANLSQYWR
jgi:hypothetical protein